MNVNQEEKLQYIRVFATSSAYIRNFIDIEPKYQDMQKDIDLYLNVIISDMEISEKETKEIKKIYKVLTSFNDKVRNNSF